ncbi:GNAT family N-acetyltransferase [Bacillus sp. FJAT-45037]|uniref:GNAT family N-acetyltransferase n=1 Tax=Bacillus sp. FJAT-45037 TaxID=2011007 RepID=UPI000C231E7D|nr:GNAT family N-acetyltransferase [Bacillus sp. FJAT-45037]
MVNEMVIRRAELKDIPEIQKVAKVTWNHTYEGLIPRLIQDKFINSAYSDENMPLRVEKTLLFVAVLNGKVVGFSNFFLRDSQAELGAIYIYPQEHSKGIGTKLLDAGINELDNVSNIFVEVEVGNKVGEDFYEAKGFDLVEEYEDEIYGHKLMTKKLVLKI